MDITTRVTVVVSNTPSQSAVVPCRVRRDVLFSGGNEEPVKPKVDRYHVWILVSLNQGSVVRVCKGNTDRSN